MRPVLRVGPETPEPWNGRLPPWLLRRIWRWHPGPRLWLESGLGWGPQSSEKQGQESGVGLCHWAGPPGQGHEDQIPGEIYLFSLPIKESEIIYSFLGTSLKDAVLKITPTQKQTHAGQRTWFKASCTIGDYSGHVGWVLNAQRKWLLPSVGPSPWPSFLLSLCGEATGGTR